MTETVGDLIRRARESLGLSRVELGQRVGVTRAAVFQWERGTTAPRRDTVPKVAQVLGVSLAELLTSGPIDEPRSAVSEVVDGNASKDRERNLLLKVWAKLPKERRNTLLLTAFELLTTDEKTES
jgi:transcriptional regulator with XRE-family HTH domain